MKHRICMVVPSFSAKGGITTVVNSYRNSKLECDYDIKYLETYCDGSFLKKICKYFFSLVKFFKILLLWHPEIVHIHSSFGGSFYRAKFIIDITSLFEIKIINHVHGSYYDEFYNNANFIKKKVIQSTYKRCNAFIALSDMAKVNLEKIILDREIYIVPNFGKLNNEAMKNIHTKGCSNTILFLGFITKKKGCFDIPKVCKLVSKKIVDVKFVLAGVGDIDKLLKAIPRENQKNFRFVGWITNKEKDFWLKKADIFFLPSYSEAMPMSILEAMGYGLPIISTRVGGIPGIVNDGINGYLYEPGDIENIANGIIDFLINNERRVEAGLASGEIIRKKFSLNNSISKIEDIYLYLLQ